MAGGVYSHPGKHHMEVGVYSHLGKHHMEGGGGGCTLTSANITLSSGVLLLWLRSPRLFEGDGGGGGWLLLCTTTNYALFQFHDFFFHKK